MTTKIFTCEICGEKVPIARRTRFNEQDLCPRCLEEETALCSHCGQRIWRSENSGSDSTPLCERCYESYYTHCANCGQLLHMDDAHYQDRETETPYCNDCFRSLCRTHRLYTIQDYYYKPEPLFFGEGPRFFGVELEIDEAGESSSNAGELMQIANRKVEHIYCKHDGSLEDGFEIVTHPMSLEYHEKHMPRRSARDRRHGLPFPSGGHLRPPYPRQPQRLWKNPFGAGHCDRPNPLIFCFLL